MSRKARVCLGDKLSIEPFFTYAGLVAACENDGFAVRIERKGKTPNTVRGVEPNLFHIRMCQAVQRIDARPPKQWAELLQDFEDGLQLVLYFLREGVVFGDEVVMKISAPRRTILCFRRHMLSRAFHSLRTRLIALVAPVQILGVEVSLRRTPCSEPVLRHTELLVAWEHRLFDQGAFQEEDRSHLERTHC